MRGVTPPPRSRPRILPRESVPAADGVRLCTDVFLPETAAPSAAILLRTPYGRTAPFLLRLAMRLNRAGLAMALQDCRGRNQSEGAPDWRREEDDGYSTLAWLGAQPWCSGRLGLLGLSISSLSLFPLAARRPPAGTEVGALANVMGAVDFRSLFYRDGALLLHWALPWLHAMGRRETTQTDWQGLSWRDLFGHLPLSEVDGDGLLDRRLWREILASPDGGAVWEGLDARDWLPEVRVPTLHLSGWYDFMLPHTIAAYRAMAAAGAAGPRAAQRLIVGPWDHGSVFAAPAGSAGADGRMDLVEVLTAWFARWLGPGVEKTGTRRAREDGDEVSLYVQGADQWVGSDRFPPEAGRRISWYLAAGDAQEARNGGGQLVTEAPEGSVESAFVYDPADPTPTAGGAVWPFEAAGLDPGPADQREVERRADVLVYSTPPLEEDLVAVGPVAVELWASSSAPTTDFTAKLVDVDTAGTPRVVLDGIVRLPPASAAAAEPHAARHLTVDLGDAGQCFRRGHRLRLEVSSSNFPKYDRNLNGAGLLCLGRSGAAAEQRVFHGGERPSHISLTALPARWVEERRIDAAVALGSGQPAPGGVVNGARRVLAALGRRVGETISSQTSRPTGLLGLVVGKLLVLANRSINRWTVAALEIESGDRVLELGFGPGFSIREAAKLAREGLVAGVDHSEVMLREARRRNAAAIRRGQVDLRQGTVAKLPFADGAFDKVLAVNSVQLWPRRVEVLKEVRRVMRPGGRIALTFGQPTWVIAAGSMKTLGLQTVADLGAAGFSESRLELRRLGRLHGYRAVAGR